eukprot:5703446-Prymnesium_polylepis.1
MQASPPFIASSTAGLRESMIPMLRAILFRRPTLLLAASLRGRQRRVARSVSQAVLRSRPRSSWRPDHPRRPRLVRHGHAGQQRRVLLVPQGPRRDAVSPLPQHREPRERQAAGTRRLQQRRHARAVVRRQPDAAGAREAGPHLAADERRVGAQARAQVARLQRRVALGAAGAAVPQGPPERHHA